MSSPLNIESSDFARSEWSIIDFVIRYLGIPIILACTLYTYHFYVDIYAADNVLSVIPTPVFAFISASVVMAVMLVLSEKIRPVEQFEESNSQLKTDIIYSISTGVLFGFLHPLVANMPAIILVPQFQELPFSIQFILGVAYLDFVLYWWHRALHESGSSILWKIHEPHHAPERLTFMAGSRAHILDVLPVVVTLCLGKLFLGFSSDIIMWLLMCPVITGAVHHTNADFRLGVMNWIFPGPEMHRIHHDKDPALSQNYSTCFPLWDVVFKTTKPFRYRGETDYGLDYKNGSKDSYWQGFIEPFRQVKATAD